MCERGTFNRSWIYTAAAGQNVVILRILGGVSKVAMHEGQRWEENGGGRKRTAVHEGQRAGGTLAKKG